MGRKGDTHAGFDQQKRLIRFFTTEVNAESDKSMHPATLLAQCKFAGDKRKCYSYLVEQGYGKVKPNVEAKQVKQRVLAGKPLPA